MLSHQSVCSSKCQRSAHIKCLFISSRFTHNITVWSSHQGLLKSNLLGSNWGHRFQWGSNFQVTDLLKLQYAVPVSVSLREIEALLKLQYVALVSWERSQLCSNFNMQLRSSRERLHASNADTKSEIPRKGMHQSRYKSGLRDLH